MKNQGTDRERISYGKFHEIQKKVDGKWLIIMDYDTTENNTIDEEDYNNAFAMDDFEKFK